MLLQVRIFNYNGDQSREIYHTKRMQRLFLLIVSVLPCFVLIFYFILRLAGLFVLWYRRFSPSSLLIQIDLGVDQFRIYLSRVPV
jgi:hypothetical protein